MRIEHKIQLNSPCVTNERSNSIELSNGKQTCILNPFVFQGECWLRSGFTWQSRQRQNAEEVRIFYYNCNPDEDPAMLMICFNMIEVMQPIDVVLRRDALTDP